MPISAPRMQKMVEDPQRPSHLGGRTLQTQEPPHSILVEENAVHLGVARERVGQARRVGAAREKPGRLEVHRHRHRSDQQTVGLLAHPLLELGDALEDVVGQRDCGRIPVPRVAPFQREPLGRLLGDALLQDHPKDDGRGLALGEGAHVVLENLHNPEQKARAADKQKTEQRQERLTRSAGGQGEKRKTAAVGHRADPSRNWVRADSCAHPSPVRANCCAHSNPVRANCCAHVTEAAAGRTRSPARAMRPSRLVKT